MLLEVSGNPLFLNSQQVMEQVNDCQVLILCMNQEDISVKVRGPPQPHGAVTVTELHINTSQSSAAVFTTSASTPSGLDAAQSTLPAPGAGVAGSCGPSSPAETEKNQKQQRKKKKKKRSSCQVP